MGHVPYTRVIVVALLVAVTGRVVYLRPIEKGVLDKVPRGK